MEKVLPCYQLMIDESVDSDLQVDYVALVDVPAIEKNFIAFNKIEEITPKKLEFTTINDEQRIVLGAAMIPDTPIYRRDDQLGEYTVKFSKDTVKSIAEKFYSKGFQNNANIMHSPDMKVGGVCYFLSFIRDTEKGMVGLNGDYPEGTWFLGAKVNNDEVWQAIKAGTIKGFSVEGTFQYKKNLPTEHEIFMQIKNLLENIQL